MTAPLPDNFPALVARAAREFGPSEAISDGDVSYSFAEVADLIDTASGALVASGVQQGPHSCLLCRSARAAAGSGDACA